MKAVIRVRFSKGPVLSFPAYERKITVQGRESMSPTEAKKIAEEACKKTGNTYIDSSVSMENDWD